MGKFFGELRGSLVSLWLAPLYAAYILATANRVYNLYVEYRDLDSVTHVDYAEEESLGLGRLSVCPAKWLNGTRLAEERVSPVLAEFLKASFFDPIIYRRVLEPQEIKQQDAELEDFLRRENGSVDYRELFLHRLRISPHKLLSGCRFENRRENHQTTEFGRSKCWRMFRPVLTDSGLCLDLRTAAVEQRTAGISGGISFVVYNRGLGLQPATVNHGSFLDGLALHIAGEWAPTIASSPVILPTGYRAFVRLSVTTRHRLKSNCTDEARLELFPNGQWSLLKVILPTGYRAFVRLSEGDKLETYSNAGCLYECWMKRVRAKCGCVLFTNGIDAPPQEFCSPTAVRDCVAPMHQRLSEIYADCNRKNPLDPLKSTCPLRCTSNLVTASIAFARNDPVKVGLYNERWNRSWDPANTTTVYVYLGDVRFMHRTKIMEVERMTLTDFMSNIGGQLGLWLGWSFLTFTTTAAAFFNKVREKDFVEEMKRRASTVGYLGKLERAGQEAGARDTGLAPPIGDVMALSVRSLTSAPGSVHSDSPHRRRSGSVE